MVRRNSSSPRRIQSRNNARFRRYVKVADDTVLLRMVCDENAKPEELAIIAEECSYDIRYHVACHPNCTEKTLLYIATHAEDASEQVAVIRNSSVTLDVLKLLYPQLPLLYKAHIEEAVPKWSEDKIDATVEEILGSCSSGLPYSWKIKLITSTVLNETGEGTDNDG